MNAVTLWIPGISCNHCVMRVEKGTKGLPGVISVEASAEDGTATLKLESMDVLRHVRAALAEIGYPAE